MTGPTMAQKAGLPPGSLLPAQGPRRPTSIAVWDYDPEHLHQVEAADEAALRRQAASPLVTWFQVAGVDDVEALARLGGIFGLHPLLLEDVASPGQRPKLEEYEDHLFIVARALAFDAERLELAQEQVALVVGRGWLVSFQEGPGPLFAAVQQRLRRGRGRIRRLGADYLAYALLDSVVDQYYVALEAMSEAAEELEDRLLERPDAQALEELHKLKRQVLAFRKAVWPLREVAAWLAREESGLVSAESHVFLRDLHDHVVQAADQAETLREVTGGLMDIYLSSMSHRMNEVMKVLTIIATLFIPLTFVAGVYGMNFQWMPELGWRWGYPAALGFMAALAGGLLVYFRKKGWL
jgi:magnesium transporter